MLPVNQTYTHIIDLAKEVEPPEDGILTRTLFNDDDVKAVIFGFGQGEKLSEHTASMPAILYFLKGEATLTLGDDTVEAQPRTADLDPGQAGAVDRDAAAHWHPLRQRPQVQDQGLAAGEDAGIIARAGEHRHRLFGGLGPHIIE